MEGFLQGRVIIQAPLKLFRHIELRHTFHLHLGAGFLDSNGLLDIGLDRGFVLVDVRKRSESDLSRGLHILGLLNKNAVGVLE